MNLKEFKQFVSQVKFGKHLPDAVYIHKDLMLKLPSELLAYLGKIHSQIAKTKEFNLLKLFKKEFRVSFLNYPAFETDPHPLLKYSLTIDLENNADKLIDYSESTNPPILHRKETFIDEAHSNFMLFSDLTKAEEDFGLYKNLNKIGFKKYWDNLISKNNLVYDGHVIRLLNTKPTDEKAPQIVQTTAVEVERHKTAISRNNLSRPLQTILGYDLLTKETTYFDYGCGLGDDLKELTAHGYLATGWDPVHFKAGNKNKAQIVNLGFVINVIENIRERVLALKDAFQLTEKLLVVSAMTKNGVDEKNGKIYNDGILTSRNTFQKYYSQEELKEFLEQCLEREAIPVAMGVFYIYKNDLEYAEHLNRQFKSKINWELKALNNKPNKDKEAPLRKTLFEKHKILLEEFWSFTLSLGRKVKANEFLREEEIKAVIGSLSKAYTIVMQEYDTSELQVSAQSRKEELLIFYALMHFKRRFVFRDLSKTLQNDITEFFGQVSKLEDESKKLLFQLGDAKLITNLCNNNSSLGYLDEQALYILFEQLNRLPHLLKLYVLCATQYYGDLTGIDLIKIHKTSGKVTLLVYDDIENNDLPELKLRVKVALRGQKIDVFNYDLWPEKQLLYYKSKYLPSNDVRLKKWAKINQSLKELAIPENEYGPTKAKLQEILTKAEINLKI